MPIIELRDPSAHKRFCLIIKVIAGVSLNKCDCFPILILVRIERWENSQYGARREISLALLYETNSGVQCDEEPYRFKNNTDQPRYGASWKFLPRLGPPCISLFEIRRIGRAKLLVNLIAKAGLSEIPESLALSVKIVFSISLRICRAKYVSPASPTPPNKPYPAELEPAIAKPNTKVRRALKPEAGPSNWPAPALKKKPHKTARHSAVAGPSCGLNARNGLGGLSPRGDIRRGLCQGPPSC